MGPNILLVEDNEADAFLARSHLESLEPRPRVTVASTGEAALGHLRREGENAQAPRPDIILLDLNLPGLSGHEVLAAIRDDHELECIPVIIFSSSRASNDVRNSYRRAANAYVVKPADLDGYERAMQSVQAFWLEVAALPGAGFA